MGVLESSGLDDCVVIVTGATSGLGVGFTRAITQAGGAVVLARRRADRLPAVASELNAASGTSVCATPTDVSDPTEWTASVEFALERFGVWTGW